MINKLFRTLFEMNLSPFIVFVALNASMFFLLMSMHSTFVVDGEVVVVNTHTDYHFIVLWLLIFSLVAATLGLIKHNKERRCRLFALLPASPKEIRLAYWCLAALYIFISTCMLVMVMVIGEFTPFMNIFGFGLLYFVNAGMLLAILSIVTSNDLPLIPEEVRRRTIPYFFISALLTFLCLFFMALGVSFYTHLIRDSATKWPMFTGIITLIFIGLVALDVRLFNKKESYLG